jgi:hypothetical protein
LSHYSGAAVWRLPILGAWPTRVHVMKPRGSDARSTASIVRHSAVVPFTPVTIGDLHVTPLSSTVVDLAASLPFAAGVAVADAALRRSTHPIGLEHLGTVDRDRLLAELTRIPLTHGAARAARVVEFADGAADRPGESVSRVSMLRAGLSAPLLQVPLVGASGQEWTVDFYWPDFNVIGEFDGKVKYTDPAFLRGRTSEQALYDEKLREDDLRAVPHGFTRWNWSTAISPTALAATLRRAGVR